MCTVSLYSNNDSVIITSNRDEKNNKTSAIPPKELYCKWTKSYFSKDPKAGGTWFVTKADGTIFWFAKWCRRKT
jgi:hypothetical protein